MSDALGNSTQEQELLRAIALWAADCAQQALPIFESRHLEDTRPREALEAGREFGQGKKRDKKLRVLAMEALRAAQGVDEPSKYAAQAAMLVASVAYTHTDLQVGVPGVRQARHVLGPAAYAALAQEKAQDDDSQVGDEVIQRAIASAPNEVRQFLKQMPPQPQGKSRLSALVSRLDAALRHELTPQEAELGSV